MLFFNRLLFFRIFFWLILFIIRFFIVNHIKFTRNIVDYVPVTSIVEVAEVTMLVKACCTWLPMLVVESKVVFYNCPVIIRQITNECSTIPIETVIINLINLAG